MQVINTNVLALNAQRNASASQGALATSIQRLSSGLRVNSAKDDAAGLAIANRMDAQVRGMNVAIRNANDGISLAQTGEGALGKVTDMLQRMRELAVQSANATNSSSDRSSLNSEYSQLASEITRTLGATAFNGTSLLNTAATLSFQIGAGTSSVTDQIAINLSDMTSTSGSLATAVASTSGISTASAATSAMTAIDNALDQVNSARATFGAMQNRFESVISNLKVASENQTAAKSRIMDADFAQETANLTRAQILQQAGTAMLAQANTSQQSLVRLLQG
jgi:flagellin